MNTIRPYRLFIGGFILEVFGVAVPFLTMLRVIEAGFFLLFASYAASILGLFMGLVGAAMYFKPRR